MIKWELKEKFDKQGTKFQAVIQRYDTALAQAGTHLADLKAEQEGILRREFRTGEDLSAEKAAIIVKIAEAEKSYEAAGLEHRRAHDYAREAMAADSISVRDLVVNWNGSYVMEVREKELQPIIERMAAARDAYYNAVLDLHELDAMYRPVHKELRQLELDNKRPGDGLHVHELLSFGSLPQVNDNDLVDIEDNKSLPRGVKRIKNGGAK